MLLPKAEFLRRGTCLEAAGSDEQAPRRIRNSMCTERRQLLLQLVVTIIDRGASGDVGIEFLRLREQHMQREEAAK